MPRIPDVALVRILIKFIEPFGYNVAALFPLIEKNVVNTGTPGFNSVLTVMGSGYFRAAVNVAYVSRPSWHVLTGSAVRD